MKITITKDELDAAYKKAYKAPELAHDYITGYSDIAEDIGECVGQGGIQDEYWYFEQVDEARVYAANDFNFEDAILALTDKRYSELLVSLGLDIPAHDNVHTLAASHALTAPDGFAAVIRECKTTDAEDQDNLGAFFPEYQKEIDRCVQVTEDDMRRDFILGDYRGNFEGIENLAAKFVGAEDAHIEGYEAITFTYEDEGILDLLEEHGWQRKKSNLKAYTLGALIDGAIAYKTKRREESAKRKEERERLATYKAGQKAQEDAERFAKIDKIRV